MTWLSYSTSSMMTCARGCERRCGCLCNEGHPLSNGQCRVRVCVLCRARAIIYLGLPGQNACKVMVFPSNDRSVTAEARDQPSLVVA